MNGVAIIPARGGSKRISRKNLMEIGGVPMLSRPIKTALAVPGVDVVIVSTDDDEIAGLSARLGAQVPGRRPSRLSSDDTPTAPVVSYELGRHRIDNGEPDFVIVMYPTSIFITEHDLQQMITRLNTVENPVEMVMTATSYPAPIERAWKLSDAGLGVAVDPASRSRQSQEFSESFYDVGQAYISRSDSWDRVVNGQELPTALHVLPPWRAWDINTYDDFRIAEALLSYTERETPV